LQGYLVAICLAALVGLGYVFQGRISAARAERAMLAGRSNNAREQQHLLDSLQDQLADLMIKKRIEEELGRRAGTLEVLIELERIMPESMALTSLTMETVEIKTPVRSPGGVRRSGRAVARRGVPAETSTKRVRLVITGIAPTDVDVANFIGQLSASSVFEDVNMGYARTVAVRSRQARQFQASCYVSR